MSEEEIAQRFKAPLDEDLASRVFQAFLKNPQVSHSEFELEIGIDIGIDIGSSSGSGSDLVVRDLASVNV